MLGDFMYSNPTRLYFTSVHPNPIQKAYYLELTPSQAFFLKYEKFFLISL